MREAAAVVATVERIWGWMWRGERSFDVGLQHVLVPRNIGHP